MDRRRFVAAAISFLVSRPSALWAAEEEQQPSPRRISAAKDKLSGYLKSLPLPDSIPQLPFAGSIAILTAYFLRLKDAIWNFRESERALRREFFRILAKASPADLIKAVSPDMMAYLPLFRELDVPLAPEPESVAAGSETKQPEAGTDTLSDVIADIIVETLELSDWHSVFITLFAQHAPVRDAYSSAAATMKSGQLRTAAGHLVELTQALLAHETRDFLVERYGRDRGTTLFRQLLLALTRKAVPFVGWADLTLSFLAALWRNADRVRRAS